jgi:hypothetical protein
VAGFGAVQSHTHKCVHADHHIALPPGQQHAEGARQRYSGLTEQNTDGFFVSVYLKHTRRRDGSVNDFHPFEPATRDLPTKVALDLRTHGLGPWTGQPSQGGVVRIDQREVIANRPVGFVRNELTAQAASRVDHMPPSDCLLRNEFATACR